MSSEAKTSQCNCEVNEEGKCVCAYTITSDLEGTTDWTCECTCSDGQKCVSKFKLEWGQPDDEAAGQTDTFICECKCGPAGGTTCTLNIVKPKYCTVTCVECGIESGTGGQCEGKKCCQE